MPQTTFHPALEGLTSDHRRMLRRAREIRTLLADEGDLAALADCARGFLAFWLQVGSAHLWEEEDVLLPAYARTRYLESDESVRHMLADHGWLHTALAELHRRLTAEEPFAGLLGTIVNRLEEHLQLEERVVYARVEAALSEEDLGRLARQSAAFRAEWRQVDAAQASPAVVEPVG